MANKTIHELNSIATLNSGDELAIYDVNGSTTGKGTIADITDIAVKKSISSLGIKNLILYPYYDNTELENGITWTDNGDGTITANGTATATSYHTLWRSVQGKFPNITSGQRYILSLEVQNGTCSIYFAHYLNSINKGEVTLREISNRYAEIEFTAWEDEYDSNALGLYIGASSAYGTLVNTTIKPMLRLASDTDNTWQPYIATNTTLTKQIGTTNITSIGDGTITGAIAEHESDISTLNGNLANGSFVVQDYSSGSMKAINKSGIYYIYNAVTDKPIASGGVLIVRFSNNNALIGAGIFIANTTFTGNNISRVSIVDGTWSYITIT